MSIRVKVGQLPGKGVQSYELDNGATVAQALRAADLGNAGDVRVNMKTGVPTNTVLKGGETILVLGKVQGNML
jgi:hypothetical protein